MEYNNILTDVEDRIGWITLNRPGKMNALSLELCDEVKRAVRAHDDDPQVRVLILKGAGDRAFSAGYDLVEDIDMQEDENFRRWVEALERGFIDQVVPRVELRARTAELAARLVARRARDASPPGGAGSRLIRRRLPGDLRGRRFRHYGHRPGRCSPDDPSLRFRGRCGGLGRCGRGIVGRSHLSQRNCRR